MNSRACQRTNTKHSQQCLQCPSNVKHDTTNAMHTANTISSKYMFKEIDGRLIGCNGDCGSKLSKILDCIAHHHDKVMLNTFLTVLAV